MMYPSCRKNTQDPPAKSSQKLWFFVFKLLSSGKLPREGDMDCSLRRWARRLVVTAMISPINVPHTHTEGPALGKWRPESHQAHSQAQAPAHW